MFFPGLFLVHYRIVKGAGDGKRNFFTGEMAQRVQRVNQAHIPGIDSGIDSVSLAVEFGSFPSQGHFDGFCFGFLLSRAKKEGTFS